MNKKLLILVAALAVTVSAAGCGQKNSSQNANDGAQKTEQSQTEVSDNYAQGASENVDMGKIDGNELSVGEGSENSKATLEESAISIEDAKLASADGQNIIIVSYKFTNKSDNAESFSSIMKSEAYQGGMSIANAAIQQDVEGYEPNSTAERIEPGKTITVQEAYLLVSDTTPVTVNVKEFHSQSGEGV